MTAEVALYGHWICPYATRVQFALHHRGVEHDLVDLPPSAVRGPDFALPPEFVEHSPRLEIPMVRVGDDYLADSIPVLEWLETVTPGPPLLPDADADRARVRERMAWIDRHAFRAMVGISYGVDDAEIELASDRLLASLAEMGAWADEAGWLGGEDLTLADAVAIPIHVRFEGLRRLGLAAETPSTWAAHGERCRGLSAWSSIEWTDEQTDEFVGRFEAFRRKRRR